MIMLRLALLTTGAVLAGQPTAPWPILQNLDGYDSTGDGLIVQPKFTDGTLRRIFVNPNATKFTLNLKCAPDQKLYVNGNEITSRGEITLKRDRTRHHQVVEAICHNTALKRSELADKQRYVFLINSDHKEINEPHLFMNQVGVDCDFKAGLLGQEVIRCADPRAADKTVSLTPSGLLDDVSYVLASSDGAVELRLLNNIPTPPFKYNKSFVLRAEAGQLSRQWTVSFGGNLLTNFLYGIGCFIAATLFGLIVTLLLVVGGSSWLGPGVPVGATEIASLFAFILQYFTLSNKLRGSNALESIATPLKWVSMFWPSPIAVQASLEDAAPLSGAGPVYSRAYGVTFGSELDSAAIGDVTNLSNAVGCMVWSFVLLSLLTLVHLAMVAYTRAGAKDGYTVPHRFSLGNWESRAINLLTLPLAAAATFGVLHPRATPLSITLGAATFVLLTGWISSVFYTVASAVNSGQVAWVWETSLRESGPNREKEQSGYWCDAECDQLLTVPVNRGIIGDLFEYRWVNTVGDIRPISLYATVGKESADTTSSSRRSSASRSAGSASSSSMGSLLSAVISPVHKLAKSSHRTANYLLAKNPQIVHVDQGRKPCFGLNGSRQMAGVLRTKWLDIMFTFDGLIRFLDYEMADGQYTPVPLLVKTSQLSGPITSGANAFFFDGVRIPFARIAETLWKIVLGVTLAVAGSAAMRDADSTLPTVCYTVVSAVSALMGTYILAAKPYSRKLDNGLVAAVAALVAASAGAMTVYSYNRKSTLADIFLGTNVACAGALTLYAIFMIISIFTAVCCAPMDESRFLEKLANCSVYVATPDSAFEQPSVSSGSSSTGRSRGALRPTDEYQLPAYSKYAAKDVVAKSTTGRAKIHKFGTFEDLDLHFDHAEVAQACTSGVLPIP